MLLFGCIGLARCGAIPTLVMLLKVAVGDAVGAAAEEHFCGLILLSRREMAYGIANRWAIVSGVAMSSVCKKHGA